MRADRLLSILLLLQVHRRVTAHELADFAHVDRHEDDPRTYRVSRIRKRRSSNSLPIPCPASIWRLTGCATAAGVWKKRMPKKSLRFDTEEEALQLTDPAELRVRIVAAAQAIRK